MKTKLIELGLSGKLADEILEAFDTYQQSVKRHSKPKGKIAFHDNLHEIEKLSRALHKKLSRLSLAERQLIDHGCNPKIFKLTGGLFLLSLSCQKVGKMNFRFSRKDPFLLDLAITIWKLLQGNGIKVTKYKNSILCKVLNVLLPEQGRHRIDESEAPDNLWAFHLLREANKRMNA